MTDTPPLTHRWLQRRMTARFPLTITSGLTLLLAFVLATPLLVVLGALVVPTSENWQHLRDNLLFEYVANTLGVMVISGSVALVIGVSTAWLIAATDFPGRRLFSWLLVLPLAAPAYIIAYLYTDLLEFAGPVQTTLRTTLNLASDVRVLPPIRTLAGAGIMLALVLYPYVYLLARAAFGLQAGQQFLAARTLGAGPVQAFFKVSLPGARPAIAGGVALVLMETLADYGVAEYFAVPTFSTGIFRTWFGLGDATLALKLAGIMLVLVLALVLFEQSTRRGAQHGGSAPPQVLDRMRLKPGHAAIALLICSMPILLGFVIPVMVLVGNVIAMPHATPLSDLLAYTGNSLLVAVLAATVATIIAVFLAYAQRLDRSWPITIGVRFATLGYALPGALLAVGLLGPIGDLDRYLTRQAIALFGWSGGLILSGTIALLVFACVIRFLTVSFNAVTGALVRVSPQMDDAARSLGAGPVEVMRRVHLPLIRGGVGVGAMLVVVDVMRELPATLILRPSNFESLATRVYRLASDERLVEASGAALTIVLVGLIPVIVLNRLGERRES